MTDFTRITNKFSYHTEDLNCLDCLYRKLKSERENKNTGCGEKACRYEDIRQDAIVNGRHKRVRGWFKLDM
jgi:hypothetical protein